MKSEDKQRILLALTCFIIASFLTFYLGCGSEADTVTPQAVSVSASASLAGTIYPNIVSVYPDGSINPRINTQIVIVFSKPIALGTVAANISITPATAYTPALASGGYAVVLTPSVSLTNSTAYTVTILTGIQDSIDGNNITTGGTFNFTTAASTAAAEQPRVISATRYPLNGATGVNKVQSYVEVTFTESVDNVTTGTFTITGGSIVPLSTSVVAGTNNKTWRLNLNPATIDYGQTYTVNLSTSIYKLAFPAVFLYDAGNLSWIYTVEADPATAPYAINDIWVESVTSTDAIIKFTTSKPYASDYSHVQTGIVSGTYTSDHDEIAGSTIALHTVTLSGLLPGSIHYFRGWLDLDNDNTYDAGETVSGEYSFRTANNATVNSPLANIANNQDGLVLLQTNGLGSHAFWVDNGSDIYGQYFTSAAGGAPQWGAGGTAISNHANIQNGIAAITDGFAEAVVIYKDTNSLYAKAVDSTGLKAGWGLIAGDQGAALGLAIKAGSSYSACIVHERPDIISSGVATMPDDGVAANLLYDANVNFSIYPWLNVNDRLLIDPGGAAWNNYAIDNQDISNISPYNLFPYVLKSSAGTPGLLSISNYYIADAGITIAGLSDDANTTNLLICSTATNLLTIVTGDIVRIGAAEWGVATGSGWTAPYFWVSIDRAIAGLIPGAAFTIYTNHAGPFNSELVTNPLWDTAPTSPFNPGFTVLTNDIVVNENDHSAGASGAAVLPIGAQDTDYALRISADIMNNGDDYSILRIPVSAASVAVGYSTIFATDFNFTDSHFPFAAVNAGDIVFNIDKNLSAMVTNKVDNSSLTLSADIFNTNIYDKAIIYTKRGFLVTYVDSSDYIAARAFNIATGASLGAAFNVCTAGTNSNPVAVSDGAGNAIIFYEKPAGIYVKKVSAKGDFLWAAPADTSAAAGISVLAGYTIVQALPDGSTGASSATGGAYLLAKNAAGTQFSLVHVVGDSGAAATVETVAGYDPQMVVDTITGEAYNRVIIVYRNINVIYYYIQVRAYRLNAYNWGPVNVSNLVTYSCYQPSITMADNTTGADSFYVSWFDGRYFNPSGYSIYSQRYDNSGTAQGAEMYVSMPASMKYDHALYMRLLYYYDDAVSPYGLMPIWLDYRTNTTTGTDIYYEQIPAP